MDDSTLAMLVSAMTTSVLLLSAVLLFVFFRARSRRLAVPPQIGADGAMSFAVRGIYTRGGLLGGTSANSINPLFAIGPAGIDVRVIRRTHLAFDDLAYADARKTLTGHALILKTREGRVYVVRFGEAEPVRRVLELIPARIAITEDAALLRDGSPAAATPGLPRYRGRMQ
ncbi:hypothetical protein BH10PSE15_BH10PSE15_05680 [soil metagenome]